VATVEAATIAANLAVVQTRMAQAATRAGRDPAAVTLVAVSKLHPFAAVEAAYAAGQRDFGENRVEELWPKVREAEARGLTEIRWHLIGTVQSRKSHLAVGPFVLIHSVDRVKLAERISRDAVATGVVMPVLLEVNVSGEASKHGFSAEAALAVAPDLVDLPGLRVAGLMTMAPYELEAEQTRPVFRRTRELAQRLAAVALQAAWDTLSMGMTNDFEVAIEEGATLVRVGSAIFGARPV
jgi:pyridoxal phosphate enzyme (YggS family)